MGKSKKYAVGADIGGSHISTAVVDMQNGQIVGNTRREHKIDNKALASEILNNWAAAIGESIKLIPEEEVAGVGFAIPGPFDYHRGIALMDKSVTKYENLYGINIGIELRKRLNLPDTLPFRYLNDALAFAVGECWIGLASKFKNVMAITLGTGLGSAFLTDGVPVIEGEHVPEKGYIYHIPYHLGIADDYFSTRWFISEYKKRTGCVCNGVKEIASKHSSEDEVKQLFEDFGARLGDFLSPLLIQFDANCLVLGGNISGAHSLFGSSLNLIMKEHNVNIPILISSYMESASIVGSARLFEQSFWIEMETIIPKI